MTATKTAALLAISASLVLAPYAALAARPEPAPLLFCSVDSACSTEFADLCSAIETSDLNDRTRNGLVTKVNDAASKVNQQKYDDANGKLDDIDATIHALDDAPKPKISIDDFTAIHAGLDTARTCSVLLQ